MKACLAALLMWTVLVMAQITVVPGQLLGAPNELEGEVAKEIEKAGKDLVDKITKLFEARVGELEKQLAARDAEIAALKKKLGEGQGKSDPAELSNAFLGVVHSARDNGAIVDDLVQGGPAAKAGIAKGDLLVAIGDRKVAGADLRAVVGAFKVGDIVKVNLRRSDESTTVDVTLVERKAFLEALKKSPPAKEKGLLGVLVGEELGVGLWVEKVEGGLTGAAAGLQVGDLVRKANGQELKVLEDLEDILGASHRGDKLTLDLTRKGTAITKVIELGGEKVAGKLLEEKTAQTAVAKRSAAKPAAFGGEMEEGEGEIYVINVTPESTAAAYGFAVRDIVRKANGKDIKTLDDLGAVLGSRTAGDLIDLVVVREGQEITVNAVKLRAQGEKVSSVGSALKEFEEAKKPKPAYLGIVAEETGEGKVVVSDLAGEPAVSGGLQKGDVVLKFEGADVKTIEDLEKGLSALHAGDEATIVVKRGEAEQTIKIKLGAKG